VIVGLPNSYDLKRLPSIQHSYLEENADQPRIYRHFYALSLRPGIGEEEYIEGGGQVTTFKVNHAESEEFPELKGILKVSFTNDGETIYPRMEVHYGYGVFSTNGNQGHISSFTTPFATADEAKDFVRTMTPSGFFGPQKPWVASFYDPELAL
jgi:hypothetical protein